MSTNFTSNIQICIDLVRDYVPVSMVYYSHIPSIFVSILLAVFVLIKSNYSYLGKLIFGVLFSFSIWMLSDILLWTSYNSYIYMFFWSLLVLWEVITYLLSLELVYYFVFKKTNLILRLIFLFISLPIILVASTKYNVSGFDLTNCIPLDTSFYNLYVTPFHSLVILSIIFIGVYGFKKSKNLIDRRKISIFVSGIVLFLFFYAGIQKIINFILNNYDINYTQAYIFEMFGLAGLPIFLALLSFVIVRFKAFDIKLIGAQALVWALVILIGSQFLYMNNMPISLLIITGATLLIASIVGMMIVRGVKKEISLREQLEVANNNQASLIHFISHQLKGFFTKSKMIFSGLIERDFGDVSQEVLDMAQIGLDSDNNAVAMVQNILKASNLKTGITDYTYQKLDLAGIVRKVAESFVDEIKGKGLEYNIDIPDKVVPSMIDETQITQVFKNLIDNSLKYTPSGQINVSVKVDNNTKKILFMVSDTGVGLSPTDRKKLFTEGGKGEESLKVNTNSTGYGLYIVKKIVESHHGRIWAESSGRGHGSKFLVELNLAE